MNNWSRCSPSKVQAVTLRAGTASFRVEHALWAVPATRTAISHATAAATACCPSGQATAVHRRALVHTIGGAFGPIYRATVKR